MEVQHGRINSFLILFGLGWITALILLFSFTQGDLVLLINRWSNPVADIFFRRITQTGEGIFGLMIALVLLMFRSFKSGINVVVTLLFVSVFTAFGKQLLFFQHERPLMFFDYIDFYRILPDLTLTYFRSFPSGHTMTAFGLATILALLFRNRFFSPLFFFWAVLVGFSRIYLCQHFFVDVVWGMLTGVLAGSLSYYLLNSVKIFQRWKLSDLSLWQLMWRLWRPA